MIQIDYKLPDDLGTWVYFDRVMVFILHEGYKGWLEGATHQAEAIGLEPYFDERPSAVWRGVHGYVTFGFEGGAAENEMPGIVDLTARPIWMGCEHINWKQQMFVAPRRKSFTRNGVEVLGTGCNILRVWLRPEVRAYVKTWTYEVDPDVSGGKVFDPNTGQSLLQVP